MFSSVLIPFNVKYLWT